MALGQPDAIRDPDDCKKIIDPNTLAAVDSDHSLGFIGGEADRRIMAPTVKGSKRKCHVDQIRQAPDGPQHHHLFRRDGATPTQSLGDGNHIAGNGNPDRPPREFLCVQSGKLSLKLANPNPPVLHLPAIAFEPDRT